MTAFTCRWIFHGIFDLVRPRDGEAVLDDACFFGCDEYRELKAKIKAYQGKASS